MDNNNVSPQHLLRTHRTSHIVLSLFHVLTHSHNCVMRAVPLLFTFAGEKTQAQRSSTTCCGRPASKPFPAGMSGSEHLEPHALLPLSSSYLILSKGCTVSLECTLTVYFAGCLY